MHRVARLAKFCYFVCLPTVREAHEIAQAFQDEWGFPGVVGLIDGTHVHIRAPEHKPDAYINRKKFHSFNVQVIKLLVVFITLN